MKEHYLCTQCHTVKVMLDGTVIFRHAADPYDSQVCQSRGHQWELVSPNEVTWELAGEQSPLVDPDDEHRDRVEEAYNEWLMHGGDR